MPETHPQSTDALPSANLAGHDQADGTDALRHLAKMSGTGSTFGASDYVAINGLAIAALLISLTGLLSLLISLFLFLQLIGVICGVLAIRKIRQSNGTQGGLWLAIGGILLSLVIGGIVSAKEVSQWITVRGQTTGVAATVSRFGDEIGAGKYDKAYDELTTDEFQRRVDRTSFKTKFAEVEQIPGYGPIKAFTWNDEPMQFETLGDGEIRVLCLALIGFRDTKETGREYIRLSKREGENDWKIYSMPRLFPEKKGRQ